MRLFRDIGLLAFASLAALFAVSSIVAVVPFAFGQRWLDVATAPLAALGGYWLSVGAWYRTTWGQPHRGEAPPESQQLSERRARVYIAVAAACVAAAAVALAGQWLSTR